MYEAKKVADWTNKMAKIEDIARKKDELNIEFINQTKETLFNKMEQSEEKREAIISDMVDKLKVWTWFLITREGKIDKKPSQFTESYRRD